MGIEMLTFDVNEAKTIKTHPPIYLAEVAVKVDGKPTEPPSVVARGYGPIKAVYHAIEKAIGLVPDQVSWTTNCPDGFDVSATATVIHNGVKYDGQGKNSDEIRAAVNAYVAALNQLPQFKTEVQTT